MKNKLNFKFLSIFALLLVAIFGSERAMAVELDTVWVSDINGQVLFQHPITKNILVAANGGITELNSQDGKFARKLPINGNCIEMSPDGTKILYCADDGVRVFDYNTFEDYLVITTKYYFPKFLGNDKILFLSVDGVATLGIYDFNTKKTSKHSYENKGMTALNCSPDGKYISYATYEDFGGGNTRAYLYLLDAETMKEIKELGNWDSEGQRIESISFSPDSKKCRILSYSSAIPITIFDIENYKVIQKYRQDEVSNHLFSIDFVGNEHILLRAGLEIEDAITQIQKIINKEVIYEGKLFINKFIFNELEYNLYCSYEYNRNGAVDKTYNLNLFRLFTGIRPKDEIYVRYNNNVLIINSIEKSINHISLMTIDGREVYRQNFERLITMNNPIEIPLELSNGLYLINITSGKDSFTQKLMVME